MDIDLVVAVAPVLVFALILLYLSVRVVRQDEKMVVFRLGRTSPSMVREPGLRFLIPIIDRPVKVDVREQFIEVPSQTHITKDSMPVAVAFLVYWRIVDPLKSVLSVVDFQVALEGVATTTMRAVIGALLFEDVLAKREEIGDDLRSELDHTTENWGGTVTRVEIRELLPPREFEERLIDKRLRERR